MQKIYYSPQDYWKGYAAIDKLASEAGVTKEEAKKFLEKQALWQVYLPPPRHIPRPHWTVREPNKVHQADLLFLLHDTVRRKTYKYALVVIDVASRLKDAEALTSKASDELLKAFTKIYSRKLKWPEVLIIDPGKEFMGSVATLMKNHDVKVKRSEAGNQRAQSFVESANKTLEERIFSHQYAQEFVSKERSRKWVTRLPSIAKALNSSVTRLTGKEPIVAYYNDKVAMKEKAYSRSVGFKEDRLPPFVKVRYLLSPGEEERGEKRRATDPVWSTKAFDLSTSVVEKDQPVLYFLNDGPKRGFVREELQVVPLGTELPPKFVLKR